MGDDAVGATGSTARVDFAGISALSSRPAGYAVALKCLQVQADAEDMDPSLKTDKRVTLHPDAWSWFQGALGEIEVGKLLGILGPEWFVRHAVPIGADTKDVDHLVIGPGGIFAINTKHHAGASVWVGDHVLRVNNSNTRHLAAAQRDGIDVSRRLSGEVAFPVPVMSVVAVVGAKTLKDSRAPQDRAVPVVDARKLVAWLKSQPAQLSSTKIDLLKLAAEEPKTWHIDPRAADTLRVMQRFERLVARVGTPRVHDARTTAPSPSRRPKPRPPARKAAPVRSAVPDIIRMWLITAMVIGGILILRGIADQPCASPAACIVPAVYLGWKPVLILVAGAFVVRAVFGTVRRLFRVGGRSR